MVIVQGASPYFSTSRAKLDVQATTSVSFYNIAPGLDVTLFGTLPDVASAAKVFSLPFNLGGNSQLAKVQMYIMARLSTALQSDAHHAGRMCICRHAARGHANSDVCADVLDYCVWKGGRSVKIRMFVAGVC